MIEMLVSKWIFQFVQVHLIHDPQTLRLALATTAVNNEQSFNFAVKDVSTCVNNIQRLTVQNLEDPQRFMRMQSSFMPYQQSKSDVAHDPKAPTQVLMSLVYMRTAQHLSFLFFRDFAYTICDMCLSSFFSSCCSGFHCWCVLYPKLFLDHSNLAIANEKSSEGWSWWAGLRSSFDATGADLIFSWRYQILKSGSTSHTFSVLR